MDVEEEQEEPGFSDSDDNSGSESDSDSPPLDEDGEPIRFITRDEARQRLYREVETQMQSPVQLTLTVKSCLINRVPDWATRFVKLPEPVLKKEKKAAAGPSGSGPSEAGSCFTENGTRRSKRLRQEKPEVEVNENKKDKENPFLALGKMTAHRSKALTAALARAWEWGAEILPNEELQRWVGLVKEELLGQGKSTELRLEKEALQAVGELYEDLREHMAETMTVKKKGKKGVPPPLKLTWPGPVYDSFVTDNAVSEEVRIKLIAEAEKFEGVRNPVTWHPNTNKTVFNILHPSLYPLMNREDRMTPVLQDAYEPVIPEEVEKIPKGQRDYSSLFHLPRVESEMMKKKDIDNHMKSYVFFGHYLMDKEFQWIPSNVWVDSEGRAHFLSYVNGLNPMEHGVLYHLLEEVLTEMVPMFEDCMNSMSRRGNLRIDFSLRSKQIQVYPRMGSVLLSPDNPDYQGGRKHAEGFDNEKILAIGVYYYSVENVTTSELTVHYSTGKYITKQDRLHHDMRETTINCAQGRCVVIPNCEHNMKPFELQDATRAGHRRSVVFFLVDPAYSVLSTADVPVQQKEWVTGFLGSEAFPDLPPLVLDRIADSTGYGLLSQKDAVGWQGTMDGSRSAVAERASQVWGNFRQPRRYD